MRNATLRQLEVFESVALHLSFTRAAQELGLSRVGLRAKLQRFGLEGDA